MPSIDDLISKLDALERKADSVGIKLNKLALDQASKGLRVAERELYFKGTKDFATTDSPLFNKISANFDKTKRALSYLYEDLNKIGTISPTNRINTSELQKSIAEITNVVNSVISAAHVVRRLNPILKNSGTGISGTYLDIEPNELIGKRIAGYMPREVPFQQIAGGIGYTPAGVNRSLGTLPREILHEIGHSLEELLRTGGASEIGTKRGKITTREREEFYQPQFFQEHMQPLLAVQRQVFDKEVQRLRSIGFQQGSPDQELFIRDRANYVADASEIFARNFSSYAQTGKSEIPELQAYMERIFKLIPPQYRKLVQDILKETKAIQSEIYRSSYSPTAVTGRGVGTQLQYSQYLKESKVTGEKTPQEIVKQVELSIDQLNRMMEVGRTRSAVKTGGTGAVTGGAQPNYLNNYYDTLDKELQNRLVTYLTGKSTGGMPTQQRATELAKQILGGEVTGGRRRIGGGARVNLDSIMNEINEIIDTTIRQSVEAKKAQYQEWLAGNSRRTEFGAPGTLTGEVTPIKDAKTKVSVSEPTPNERIAQQKQNAILLQELEKLEKQEAATAIKANRDAASEIQKRNDQMALLVGWAEKQAAIDKRASEKIRVPKTSEEVYNQISEYRGKKLLAEAGKIGFTAEDIKKPIITQRPSDVSIATFEKVDETTQAVTRAEITVDKYGRTLTRTNKRLLGFTDAIIRNTQEILRWSVGVGLVYGTMYRLQELMKLAIDNETKLADIAVVLGDAQRDVNTIFEEAATVANETGENINAVLETYSLAYRAVGAIKDPVERTNSAIQLLTDSTVLNKLSTLDAATSIDVLAGSLRQLQQPGESAASAFSKGTDLLDKWVAITRKANVDLATLATAFSITSESAENSGVSISQLNGIIASLAEKIGGLGGRETGNAVRALIGGVYQQQASEILTQYGIAVQDTAGKMRPFLDISKEIYDLYKAGVVSADELNKIGYTLGGGVRRGQQYVAFLSDFERIQELANLQTTAAGSAQEALGRKMETTQTALTKMNNAFQSLAQTLGTKGGVLDSFGGLVSTLTLVVSFLDKVVGKLGSITIPASVLAIAAMVFKGDVGKLRMEGISSKIGGFAQGTAMGTMNRIPIGGFREETKTMKQGELVKEFIPTDKARKIGADIGYGFGKYAPGIFLSAIPGILKGMEGDWAGAGVSIGGAVVGTILAGGNPIGGLIGSVIAETFLNAIENRAPDIDKIVQDILDESTKKTEEGGLKSTTKQIEKLSIQEQLNLLVGEALQDAVKRYPVTSPQSAMRIFGEGGTYADKISEEYKQKITKFAQENVPVEVSDELMRSSKYEAERLALIVRERELIDDIIEKRKEEMRVLSATGEITPKEQMGMNKVLLGLDASLSKIDLAFGEAFDEINTSINGTEERFNTFTDILLAGTEEQRIEIISAAQEYLNLSAAIDKAVASGQELVKLSTGEEIPLKTAIENRDNLGEIFPDYLNLINQEQQLSKIKIPTTVGLDLANMKDYEMVIKKAFEDQDTYFNELILNNILSPEQVEILKTRADDLWADVGEGLPGQLIKGLTDTRFLTEAKDALEDALSSVNIGFQEFDFPLATIEKAVAQASVIGEQWKNLYGYKPEIEEQLVIDSEGMVKPIKADWKITNYLLQQILDTEKKQLDGIYNLPEGAGFYVPYQTLDLAYQKGLNEAAGQAPTGEFKDLTNLPPYTVEEAVVQKAYADALKAQTNKALERDKLTEDVYKKKTQTYLPYVSVPGEKLKSMPRGDITKQEPTFWDSIKKFFDDVRNIPWDAGSPAGTIGKELDFKTLFDGLSNKLSTTFNLNLNSTTTLLVDGRVLAEVVKNYLHEDMVRYENTGGAINRTVAI